MPLILLAEDESSTIDHVRSALSSQGWLVKTVDDRDKALRAASEFAPQLVLVNDSLAGAEDLVRTFSRRSGGPGVILLTTEGKGETEASAASPHVDAVLAKPLDTAALIETIRQGLVDGKDKPAPPPVADTKQVFSSEEIFGDLLDDILDPEAEGQPEEAEPEPIVEELAAKDADESEEAAVEETIEPAKVEEAVVAATAEPQPAPKTVAEDSPVVDLATSAKIDKKAKPAKPKVAEKPEAPAVADGEAEVIPVAGLEDLEEVVREGVEAWADTVHPDEAEESDEERLAEVAEAAQIEAEPEPEPEEDLEGKLEDTLAGVLAASLSQSGPAEKDSTSAAKQAASVDALLSQALGDLDLVATVGTPKLEEVAEGKIDDEIEALAASVEIEPIAEIETPDFIADVEELTGVREAPEAAEPETLAAEDGELQLDEPTDSVDLIDEEVAAETAPEQPDLEFDAPAETVPQPAPAAVGVEFGEYTLEQQIGVGGMASVWKARRKGVEGFEKRVAIKKILPQAAENEDFVEMFIDEAKLAAQLNHNNITHIYDLGKIDDDYFIAMEYVEGKNLRQILDKTRKKQQPIPVGVALFVASQIADALDYAHRSKDFDDAELGLVHRDVSPQNVLISFAGDIKLCDFGIAKAVSKISTTQMGALKGKLQYMSPEQAWGKAIDHRSDLFSLGTLLYEMLTGERLFSGDSEMAVLEAVRDADVGTQIIQSPDIPAGVKGVLLRSLAKEPEDRFESAAQLQRGLEELLKEESPMPGPKNLSAFVRDLLGMQPEPPEPAETEQSDAGIEVAEDLEWSPETGETEEEDETTPWLRRLLTRLLPVILVVAVGGGIIAALMQDEAPSTPTPAQQAVQVVDSPAPESVVAAEETAVDPQGQPPPTTAAAADPNPAPPATKQPQEPAPEPAPTTEAQVAEEAPVEAQADSTVEQEPDPAPMTDPELERAVEEDLQRVQELMAAPGVSQDPEVAGETTGADDAAQGFTLESLWSDVTAETDPIKPGPGVVEPRILDFQAPEYSAAAQETGAAGTIRVSVLVGEDGRALESRLLQGIDSQVGLEEAVVEAARQAVYQPASKDGVPAKMWHQVAVTYPP